MSYGLQERAEDVRARRPWVLGAAPVLALVTAAAVGTVVGGVLAYLLATNAHDRWSDIGAYLIGTLIGVVVGVVGYVAALIFAAGRMFPAGRRAVPVVLTLLGHAVVGGVVSVLGVVLRPTEAGEAAIAVLVALAALGCGPAVFLRFGATGRARRVAVPAVAVILAVTSVVAVVAHVARRADDARVLAQMPFVLFGGDTADPAYPGWQRDRSTEMLLWRPYDLSERGRQGDLKYSIGSQTVALTMYTEVGDCATPVNQYTCAAAGSLPAGQLRLYRLSYAPEAALVLVFQDGSGVSVEVNTDSRLSSGIDLEQARGVLGDLRRVNRARFEERTGIRPTVP
ncbi:hypothetical protein AB0368_34450 [Actinoplanes sp. NPDC051475]|uniref:hypothetical protein n=1 Tax=Actinoplanes sp. NPDC051475 TaxID=3157225 RepID=UPI00344E2FCA